VKELLEKLKQQLDYATSAYKDFNEETLKETILQLIQMSSEDTSAPNSYVNEYVIGGVCQYGHDIDGELARLNKLVESQGVYCKQKHDQVEALNLKAQDRRYMVAEDAFCRTEYHPKVGQVLLRKFEDQETEDPAISIEFLVPGNVIRTTIELTSYTGETRDKLFLEMTGDTLVKRLESVVGAFS